jgi:hypothetical protein
MKMLFQQVPDTQHTVVLYFANPTNKNNLINSVTVCDVARI